MTKSSVGQTQEFPGHQEFHVEAEHGDGFSANVVLKGSARTAPNSVFVQGDFLGHVVEGIRLESQTLS